MKLFLNKLKRFFKQFRGLFSSPLPVGGTEFYAWVDDIIDTYALPTYDRDSVIFGLGSMIMHLGPQCDSKPKYYFAKSLRAGAAKQVASAAFTEIKLKHQAAQAAKPVEATTKLTVVGNEAKHPSV